MTITSHGDVPRAAMVLETGLGHAAHAHRLQTHAPDPARLDLEWMLIDETKLGPVLRRTPNWTVQSGLAARAALSRGRRVAPFDVVFFHTQTVAMLNQPTFSAANNVVSIDATPKQIDRFGDGYDHQLLPTAIERAKHDLARRCFAKATGILTTSNWAAKSLEDEYSVDPAKIRVAPFGVDLERWSPADDASSRPTPTRLLFVGGQFERKGGPDLLEAIAPLDASSLELHIVGDDPGPTPSNVVWHGRLQPDSDELLQLFRCADVFCLPTHADCSPIVLNEAAAVGLPSIASDCGAIAEQVIDGSTGFVVQPGDVRALRHAIESLVENPACRARMGVAARRHVEETADLRRTATTIYETIAESARRQR